MKYYEELLASLKLEDPEKAEFLEEEVNIMIHKLKFLLEESFPSVVILSQEDDFEPLFSESLHEKVILSGGRLLNDKHENPNVIVLLQHDESLYSSLPELLGQSWLTQSLAYQNNAIFIIEYPNFGRDLHTYLTETEILAEILQPKYFYFGHEGNGWTKFEVLS